MKKNPDILSGEQVRLILHISKRKAAWLLENGQIRCTISEGKTRKFTVLRSDLEDYIRESKLHPERYRTPEGKFTSVQARLGFEDPLPAALPDSFRLWLEQRWQRYHLLLTLPEVSEITGYSLDAIRRWIRNGTLRSLAIPGDVIVPREWLVDFYCSAGKKKKKLSTKHRRMLIRYFKQN